MRLGRDENSPRRAAAAGMAAELGVEEHPLTFQGLVLAASAPDPAQWESEPKTEYPLNSRECLESSSSVFSGGGHRGCSGENLEPKENEVRPRQPRRPDPIDEDKPPITSIMSARVPATRSRARSQPPQPQLSIELPADRATGDEEQDEDAKEEEEQDLSPLGSSPAEKKARKRPHYLSHEDRCQIIERIAGGEQQAALAREFGVTRAAVCHIQKHRFEILARPVAQPTFSSSEVATPTRDHQLVQELRTPSVLLLLTTLRDRRSDAASFRRATGRIIMILIEEVLGQLDARAVEVTTSSGLVITGIERKHGLCGVKLGDEGYPFSVLFHQVEVEAAEGYIHVDSTIGELGRRQWRLDRMDLPASIASCKVLLFTATCSTGGRECKAIEALVGVGTPEQDITLVAIVCASDGVVAICSRFPQVRIVTAAVDTAVDSVNDSIIPGLGDFIARYNNEYADHKL